MKLVLAAQANSRFFHLLDDLKDEGVTVVEAFDDETLRAEIADADALYGWPSASALAQAGRLRWIQTSSAGVDQLWSRPELQEREVVITNTRGAHAPNIAEHAFALLLAFSRGVLVASEAQAARRWEGTAVREVSWELAGSTLGIIGYGQIGRAVGARARGFEMEVIAVDREAVAPDDAVAEVWPLGRLDDLLAAADVAVVTAPYTPQARGMLSAAQFATMKPDAGLIVVSRGGLVDHDALIDALQDDEQGPAYAGLDATPTEPLPADSPLWGLPNCLITPHSSGHSRRKERRAVEILRENARRFAQGEPLINVVDKTRGY
ncbi:MAG: hydroxyacid dehydrogenase [Dehalococcoidia bacterium]|nr:hydroxyacid dehydrogenase [Dehalococcoidia bacterium]